uniref:Uncharacterized protein n=1 Tax=Cucumis sativus TaxID=3659 RepID=A0A0A0KS24_CUCSA
MHKPGVFLPQEPRVTACGALQFSGQGAKPKKRGKGKKTFDSINWAKSEKINSPFFVCHFHGVLGPGNTLIKQIQ